MVQAGLAPPPYGAHQFGGAGQGGDPAALAAQAAAVQAAAVQAAVQQAASNPAAVSNAPPTCTTSTKAEGSLLQLKDDPATSSSSSSSSTTSSVASLSSSAAAVAAALADSCLSPGGGVDQASLAVSGSFYLLSSSLLD